ncbi:hypothetical protein ES708_06132 [subsurface metagenome]
MVPSFLNEDKELDFSHGPYEPKGGQGLPMHQALALFYVRVNNDLGAACAKFGIRIYFV